MPQFIATVRPFWIDFTSNINSYLFSDDKTKLHLFSIILGALTFGVMAIEVSLELHHPRPVLIVLVDIWTLCCGYSA
jgi:hypothetical protein